MTVPSSPRVRPRTTILLAAAFAASAALPAPALGPEDFEWHVEPLANINPEVFYLQDLPSDLLVHNDTLYFRQNTQLWLSDATDEGTGPLLAGPGGKPISSVARMQRTANGFYFVSPVEGAQFPLWISDGTVAGTRSIASPGSDIVTGTINNLTSVGGLLFFTTFLSSTGMELWVTNGSEQGTYMVKDIRPGTAGSSPSSLVSMGGILYFVANDGTHGTELWRSNGEPEGTYMVKDIRVGGGSSNPTALTVVGNRLYFMANDNIHGNELWISDGTEAGTRMVLDFAPGSGGSVFGNLRGYQGNLYFTAWGQPVGLSGNILWRTDGTEAGTVPVVSDPEALPTNPRRLGVAAGQLYFNAVDPVHGRQVFRTDGTAAGTVRITTEVLDDFEEPGNFHEHDGYVYFTWDRALWRTDGTPEGVERITPIGSFLFNSEAPRFQDVGGALVFVGSTFLEGRNLWRTDGTAEGTRRIRESGVTTRSSSPAQFTDLDGTLLFRASEGPTGTALWKSDGTQEGTMRVKDIRPGTANAGIELGAVLDGLAYFGANDGIHGAELWRTDGTEEGTQLALDIEPGPGSSSPKLITAFGDGLLGFIADEGGKGGEVWRSDGTEDGTIRLTDLVPGFAVPYIVSLQAFAGDLYFAANDFAIGTELYATDGTIEGTRLLTNLRPESMSASTHPSDLVEMGGSLYFVGSAAGLQGRYLFTTDGTMEGTQRVSDLAIHPSFLIRNHEIAVLGDKLLFAAMASGGLQLASSDGTDEGTAILKVINPTGTADPEGFAVGDGIALFAASDGVNGRELWATDGTQAGTRMVADLRPGPAGSEPRDIVFAGGVAFFTADDGFDGRRLWKTDGTPEGTVRILDGVAPGGLFACGGVLYFVAANHGTLGDLHGISIAEAATYEQPVPVLSGPATADGPFTLGLDFGREVRVLLPEEVLVENGSVAALRDLGGGLFEIDILPDGLATVSASIPASVVRDLGANANAASEPFSTAMFPSAVGDWIDRGW